MERFEVRLLPFLIWLFQILAFLGAMKPCGGILDTGHMANIFGILGGQSKEAHYKRGKLELHAGGELVL